jgi:hypothetical protein
MIDLNVTALTRLALAALRGFVARKNGLLINIASVVAFAPDLLNGTYSGSKAYMVNFTPGAEERSGRQRRDGAGCAAWRDRNVFVGKGRPPGGAFAQRDRDDC